ncbi:hypothetical protein C1752_01753 [Acaryochloris thomasi RCC1774]|uniref:DUF3318 domain-containing protein n=1 Tax=Acaryochloris thomasi RCC1774 TaxID=1764569 RepID=A0A2W1JZP1_9CYAN|nr:DUF3318 domain-containing protein [Acaryochloris thomasi]PZD73921.1 hypothetical protein C1752_01753 [Acaryochloris thomasi RCC1774]
MSDSTNPNSEIRRLLDVMPASGRMNSKIVQAPLQSQVIDCGGSILRLEKRPITINFDLWSQLPQPQCDLLLLRTVGWLKSSRWLKPDLYQGGAVAGLVGTLVELVQGDAVGVVVAAGLGAIATTQIWRNTRGLPVELEADNLALKVAQRRGYSEPEAAQHLMQAIKAAAQLEKRASLTFNELIRSQNLLAIAGLSTVDIPQDLRS